MTNEAQAARNLIDAALKNHAAVLALGIDEQQLMATLKLGKAAGDFLGAQQRPSGIIVAAQFEKVLDGGKHVITRDLANGIEWDVAAFDGKEFNAKQSTAACAGLRTGGFTDWREPRRRELLTLVDDTRYSPAIDTEYFPGTKSGWYRTSTVYAPDSGCRWGVYFDDGSSGYLYDGDGFFVRAVRASQ